MLLNLVVDINCLQASLKLSNSPAIIFNMHYRILVNILNSLELKHITVLHVIGASALNLKRINYINYIFEIKFWPNIKTYTTSLSSRDVVREICINWSYDENTSKVWQAIYKLNSLNHKHISYLYGCNNWKVTKRPDDTLYVNIDYKNFRNHALMMFIVHTLPYLIELKNPAPPQIYILIEEHTIYIGLSVITEKLELVLKNPTGSYVTINNIKLILINKHKLQKLTPEMIEENDNNSYNLTKVKQYNSV